MATTQNLSEVSHTVETRRCFHSPHQKGITQLELELLLSLRGSSQLQLELQVQMLNSPSRRDLRRVPRSSQAITRRRA